MHTCFLFSYQKNIKIISLNAETSGKYYPVEYDIV